MNNEKEKEKGRGETNARGHSPNNVAVVVDSAIAVAGQHSDTSPSSSTMTLG